MSDLRKYIEEKYNDESLLFADGFDDAIIGISLDLISSVIRVVYSTNKCIEILVKNDGMSELEAIEYLEFNVIFAYVGVNTPIWVDTLDYQ